jgi:hypothetical protein
MGQVRTQHAARDHPPRMTEAEIQVLVDQLADVARILRDADPDDKAEVFGG